jgi:hypothetical protein
LSQALFHHRERILAGFGKHDAVGMQSGAGKAGGEKVRLLEHPQNRPLQPRQDAGDQKGGCRAMFHIRTGAEGFMQGRHRQAALRQSGIDCGEAEGKRLAGQRVMSAFNACDPIPQFAQQRGVRGRAGREGLPRNTRAGIR